MMNKEQLLKAGFTEEQVTQILKFHKDTIDTDYVPKHRFDEVNQESKDYKKQVEDRDKQITDLKKFEGDNEQLKTKIKELEDTNKNSDTEYQKSLSLERKKNGVRLALLEDEKGKPHDTEMVLGLLDLEKIEVDEGGKIVSGYKEQAENIRKEKSFLFGTNKPEGGEGKPPEGINLKGGTPPDGQGTPPAGNESESYGKSLAAVKLGMMGVKPVEGNE